MSSEKVKKIKDDLMALEIQYEFLTSCMASLMSEANHLDMQAHALMSRREEVNNEIRDLEAELKDTI